MYFHCVSTACGALLQHADDSEVSFFKAEQFVGAETFATGHSVLVNTSATGVAFSFPQQVGRKRSANFLEANTRLSGFGSSTALSPRAATWPCANDLDKSKEQAASSEEGLRKKHEHKCVGSGAAISRVCQKGWRG